MCMTNGVLTVPKHLNVNGRRRLQSPFRRTKGRHSEEATDQPASFYLCVQFILEMRVLQILWLWQLQIDGWQTFGWFRVLDRCSSFCSPRQADNERVQLSCRRPLKVPLCLVRYEPAPYPLPSPSTVQRGYLFRSIDGGEITVSSHLVFEITRLSWHFFRKSVAYCAVCCFPAWPDR